MAGFDLAVLGPEPPPTHDPVLLALRRLVRRDFGELRARHRAAAEMAADRPFGLLFLVLEEAACWQPDGGSAAAAGDEPWRIFSELTPTAAEAAAYPRELEELRSRALAEIAERRIAVPGTSWIWRT